MEHSDKKRGNHMAGKKIKNSNDLPRALSSVEEQKKHYEQQKQKQRKTLKYILIIFFILLILFIFSIIFSVLNINNDKIISGISINNNDVSGLSVNEAKGKIETIISEKNSKILTLKYQDFETEINPELIELHYDIEGTVNNAYDIGRNSNIFINNYNILFTLLGKKNIDVNISLNEEQLEKTLKDASSNLPGAIKEPSYYIEDDNLIITKGTKGVVIDIPDTINKIKAKYQDINSSNQDYLDLTIIEKEPEAINIDKIYEEVHKDAKDAYFVKDPFELFPEVDGVDFNKDEAKKLLNEDKNEYTIKLTINKPKVTLAQIGTEAFPDRLSIFTTRYDASNYNRTTNLRLACEKINGKVLLAGETFSYNKTVGERTIAAGYKEAKIYAAGEVVDGLGGGICQISSTLYNAVVMANLEIVERRNHQFVTSYLPAGRDATVVYGLTDFQFKNTRKYPVRLVAGVKNGIATVEVYGIKGDEEYNITFDVKTVGTLPYSTKYIDDDSLEAGSEVVKQNGANGLQTETYITKSLNGKVVSRELLSKDTYTPMQKIIKKSTKTVENSENAENPKDSKKKKKDLETQNTQSNTQQSNNTTTLTNTQSNAKTTETNNAESNKKNTSTDKKN